MLAFNVLRVIGQEVIARADLAPIQIKVRRWRLKTVLQNIVYCAVRVIRHAREIKLRKEATVLQPAHNLEIQSKRSPLTLEIPRKAQKEEAVIKKSPAKKR